MLTNQLPELTISAGNVHCLERTFPDAANNSVEVSGQFTACLVQTFSNARPTESRIATVAASWVPGLLRL